MLLQAKSMPKITMGNNYDLINLLLNNKKLLKSMLYRTIKYD